MEESIMAQERKTWLKKDCVDMALNAASNGILMTTILEDFAKCQCGPIDNEKEPFKPVTFQEWLYENNIVFGLALTLRSVPSDISTIPELRHQIWKNIGSKIDDKLTKMANRLASAPTTNWNAYEVDQMHKLVNMTSDVLTEAEKNWQ